MSIPKRIMIEGPDGAGKTTLAKMIREWIQPAMLVAWTKPAGDDAETRMDYTLNTLWPAMIGLSQRMTQTNLIYDRTFVSQFVYGATFDGLDYSRDFEKCVDAAVMLRHRFVFLRTPTEELMRRVGVRGDWNADLNEDNSLVRLNNAYDGIIRYFQQPGDMPSTFVLDWSEDPDIRSANFEALRKFVTQ